MRTALRAGRAFNSRMLGRLVAAAPWLERPFVTGGRWIAHRSHLLGTLYWFAEDDLIKRLRISGRRFRELAIAGIPTLVDVTDGSARLHYFHGEPYEPELASALRKRLEPGDVLVDVGANIGFFSVLAARIVGPGGRVIAFEPHPDALATFRAAVRANAVDQTVDIVVAAAGSSDGSIRLFLSDDPVLSTTDPLRSPARAHFGFERSIDVRLLTLDAWFAEHMDVAGRIKVIKIDVEGTEADVLSGMRRLRAARPDATIVLETDIDSDADRLLVREGYARTPLERRSGTYGNYVYEKPRT